MIAFARPVLFRAASKILGILVCEHPWPAASVSPIRRNARVDQKGFAKRLPIQAGQVSLCSS